MIDNRLISVKNAEIKVKIRLLRNINEILLYRFGHDKNDLFYRICFFWIFKKQTIT